MRGITYFIIVLVATTLGSMTGMGGGVIIKPALDILNDFDISNINVLSSVTVFAMSVVSIIKYIKNGIKINIKMAFLLGLGSVLGGFFGEKIFYVFVKIINNDEIAKSIQSTILIAILLTNFIYVKHNSKFKTFKLKVPVTILLSGVFLGTLSSFLGIGGGPINVSLLMLLFSLNVKEAAAYSIVTIFFSQLSKLANIAVFTGFYIYKLDVLLFMLPASILGGFIGSAMSKTMNMKKVEEIFIMVLLCVIFIALYTAIKPILT